MYVNVVGGFPTGITMPIPGERARSSAAASEALNPFNTRDTEVAPKGTIAMTLATKIAMSLTDDPSAISTSSPGSALGSSTARVIAIVGVVTTIALAAIALWQGGQGIRYPRREHQEAMKTLVVQRKRSY
ncbi:hypothetical protein FRB93_000818 [Tulasnella sp. JGI-2019a]|nr:hypothetical protein FRB93_000818 [Tulasnella sp. JGI-2019a]